jgi:hypothetical protein
MGFSVRCIYFEKTKGEFSRFIFREADNQDEIPHNLLDDVKHRALIPALILTSPAISLDATTFILNQ